MTPAVKHDQQGTDTRVSVTEVRRLHLTCVSAQRYI